MRGKIIDIANGVTALLARLTSARATKLDNLDAAVSTLAPASTAVSNVYWTNALAAALSSFLGAPIPSAIRSIQFVDITTMSSNTSETVTITAVTTAKSIIVPAGNVFNNVTPGNATPENTELSWKFASSTSVTVDRGGNVGLVDHARAWVVEFN